jgi:tetratricopeptide (TPR) repeat protein
MHPCTDSRPLRYVLLAGMLSSLMLSACAGPSTPRPQAMPRTAATIPVAPTGDADRRFDEALSLLRAGRHSEAREAFHALADEYPELSGPLTNLGLIYARGRDHDQALDHVSRAVSANPRNAVAYHWLGILYREYAAYRQAEQAYLRALSLEPDYAVAHRNLGILYDAFLQQPDKAIEHYRQYLKIGGEEELIVQAWIMELEQRAAAVRGPETNGARSSGGGS